MQGTRDARAQLEPDPAPLAGLTIVEAGAGVAVAACGKLLVDLGATVLKVEDPSSEDPVRHRHPDGTTVPDPAQTPSAFHLLLGAGKQSLALPLTSPAGRRALDRLLDGADALIGFVEPDGRLAGGPPPASLARSHPALPILALSWYGLTGPWRHFRGSDYLAQHASGFAFSTATRVDDLAAQPPVVAPGYLTETTAGLTGAIALLCLLLGRDRDPAAPGDLIDLAVVETFVNFLRVDVSTYTYGAGLVSRKKEAASAFAFGQLPASGGMVDFVIPKEPQWQAFMEILGHPEWAQYEMFATMPQRTKYWDALEPLLAETMQCFPRSYIIEEGQRRGIAIAPVHTVAEAAELPQFVLRDFFVEGEHPAGGRLRYPGPPFRLSDESPAAPRPAPDLGEHTAAILTERLGFTPDEIASLAGSQPDAAPSEIRPPRRAAWVRPRATAAADDLPLRGIRVADFSWIVAGPAGTQLLARMGAEVIKIEGLAPIDYMREYGPFVEGHSSYNTSGRFNSLNGAKHSVTLQLTDPAQARLAREIALASDLVVENFGFGAMDRFGLGYEGLAAAKPELVMVSGSGFGHTGPLRENRAFVHTISAYVGLTASTGYEHAPGFPPGAYFSDQVAGFTITLAALAGLRQARRVGRGRHIDLAMTEATMALMGPLFLDWFLRGVQPQRRGNALPELAPCGVYPCRGDDKWLALAVADETEWSALVAALGNPAWAADPRFADLPSRLAHRTELDALIGACTRRHDNLALATRLQRAGVPAVPSSDAEDLVRNSQLTRRGAIAPQRHTCAGVDGLLVPNLPWHLASRPELDAAVPAPPRLGQDNRRVLEALTSAPPDQIAALDQMVATLAHNVVATHS